MKSLGLIYLKRCLEKCLEETMEKNTNKKKKTKKKKKKRKREKEREARMVKHYGNMRTWEDDVYQRRVASMTKKGYYGQRMAILKA